jgi:hypothetical protein
MKDPRFRKCPAVSLRTEAITCGLMLAQLNHELTQMGSGLLVTMNGCMIYVLKVHCLPIFLIANAHMSHDSNRFSLLRVKTIKLTRALSLLSDCFLRCESRACYMVLEHTNLSSLKCEPSVLL